MNLRDALTIIDECYDIPQYGENVPWWDAVINDHIGGVDTGWHSGSVFADEGRLLYALVRALRPAVIWEVGCAHGCSASHMLQGLEHNNKGKLFSADLYEFPGAKIPEPLQARHVIFQVDAAELFTKAAKRVTWPDGRQRKLPAPDMIFDDGGHRTDDVAAMTAIALEHLNPGGIMVWHDTMHPHIGERVRNGIQQGGIREGVRHFLIEPADTGMGVWQK